MTSCSIALRYHLNSRTDEHELTEGVQRHVVAVWDLSLLWCVLVNQTFHPCSLWSTWREGRREGRRSVLRPCTRRGQSGLTWSGSGGGLDWHMLHVSVDYDYACVCSAEGAVGLATTSRTSQMCSPFLALYVRRHSVEKMPSACPVIGGDF